MSKSAADVFISYKAEDRARLQPLVVALEAEGFTVWWDAHIGGGANWRQDIQENLDAAKCVIVAWSKRSVGQDGNFVRDEASRAQRRGVYLPVRLDPVDPPLGFGEVQALSLKGWKGDRSDPRFRAVADAVRSRITGEHIAPAAARIAEPRVSRRAVLAGGAGAAALAAAGGWVLLKPTPANAKRIAVLPFANLSADPQQAYFSEGVAEELRSALSRIGLEVIGRTSSDAVKDLDAKAAAAKLGVGNILTGSVRRSPEMIRINAQLVGGSDGVERWAQSYDRAPGDAIKIQTDIATNVAQALSIALGQAARAAISLGSTADSVAQDLLLQSKQVGRDATGAEIIRKSLALAEAAIARDPNYADAHVEKAIALTALAQNYPANRDEAADQIADSEAAARRAIALAPRLGSAYAALSLIELSSLNFESSLRYTKQALALSPEDPNVLVNAPTLAWFGHGQEALRLADRLVALDPLAPRSYRYKAEVLKVLRHYPQTIEACRKELELAPSRSNAHIIIGDALTLSGQHVKAKAEYRAVPADNPFGLTGEALVAARTRDAAGAQQALARMKQLFGAAASYQYAEIYAQLGDKDRAFAELDNAVQAKDPGLVYVKLDPFLDPIRGDPRYAALLRRLNFP